MSKEIVKKMYKLTDKQVVWYGRLEKLVEEALNQSEAGYAVNVEKQIAKLAKKIEASK